MLNQVARVFMTRVLTPTGRFLVDRGISADTVSILGTLGVVMGAVIFFPTGQFLIGTLVVVAFVFSDTLDGIMARISGTSSPWGAFLDSSLDRLGDGAIFGSLVMYFVGPGDNAIFAAVALANLIVANLVSYVRARAEGLGFQANLGIVERADRLVVVLVTTGFVGLGLLSATALGVVLIFLLVASLITVIQRVQHVHQSSAISVNSGVQDG